MDFIFQPGVQALFDAFSALFSIRIAFYTPAGEELRAGAPNRNSCEYCHLLRTRFGYEERCRALDRQKRDEAARLDDPLSYRCHAGLTEAILPVRRAGRLIGFVMIGQFRTHNELPVAVRRHLAGRKDCAAVRKAFECVPLLPAAQLPHVLTLFATLVQYINNQGLIATRREALLDTALAFLRANIHRPVALAEIAALLNRSPGTVSNLFRDRLGKSFKETLIGGKIERARELLGSDAQMTVKEAASRVGYEDALYFSRLFTKYCGRSPQDFQLVARKKNPSKIPPASR